MLVVSRFRVPLEDGETFRAELQQALDSLAERPGHLDGTIGRNVDDPELWVLSTRWENVGAYRRALSAYDVKLRAVPLLSRALDEPSAYEVVEPGTGDRADQVYFALDVSPIKDEYTLAYDWDGDRQVTWTLVEGKMLRALDGAYELRDRGDGSTEVTYRLALDVSIPLIGMLKRKGEKILIDAALKGLKKRVESL